MKDINPSHPNRKKRRDSLRFLIPCILGIFALLPLSSIADIMPNALKVFSEDTKNFPIYIKNASEQKHDLAKLDALGKEKSKLPIKVEVGVFFMSIDSFDYKRNTFSATFWVWFVFDKEYKDIINPYNTFEILNFLTKSASGDFIEEVDGKIWQGKKMRGEFKHKWNLAEFPSDRQDLTVLIDEGDQESNIIEYVADTANSGYSKEHLANKLLGWSIAEQDEKGNPSLGFEISHRNIEHETNYGNPSPKINGEKTKYTAVEATIKIRRDSWHTFIKLHMVIFVAFIISWLVLLLSPKNNSIIAARIGVLVAMIYSIAINIQYVDAFLGSTPLLTKPDKIQMCTLAFIVYFFIVTIINFKLLTIGKDKFCKRLDMLSFIISPILYFIIVLLVSTKL